MKERQTFRFYPTDRQKRQLEKEFGCARHAYNFCLKFRTDSFKNGKSVNYAESSLEWTKHRNDPNFKWLLDTSSVVQQQAVRHLQRAFINFFAKRTGYPKFHTKKSKQGAEYTLSAFKLDRENRNLTISKVGRIRVKWSRTFTSNPTTVTINKDRSGRFFVTLCLDEPKKATLHKTGLQVGIDLGINRIATLSTGERIANPYHTSRHAAKLRRLQRVMDRRIFGSGRWRRQRLKVAKLHAHIADARKDFLNKLTTDLVRRFDVIAIENLNVSGMLLHPKLAKQVACASFGMFRLLLTYKAGWYGKEIRTADRFFPSSKRCCSCGHIHERMPLNTRQFVCESCGERHDRDENAAKNILKFAAVGQTVKARGESVSLCRAKARKSSSRRNVNRSALHSK